MDLSDKALLILAERIYKCTSQIDDDDVRIEILDTAGQVLILNLFNYICKK